MRLSRVQLFSNKERHWAPVHSLSFQLQLLSKERTFNSWASRYQPAVAFFLSRGSDHYCLWLPPLTKKIQVSCQLAFHVSRTTSMLQSLLFYVVTFSIFFEVPFFCFTCIKWKYYGIDHLTISKPVLPHISMLWVCMLIISTNCPQGSSVFMEN